MDKIEVVRKTWRPALGWVIVLIIFLEFTVFRFVGDVSPLSETMVGLLVGGGLGAAATRSFDKLNGNG